MDTSVCVHAPVATTDSTRIPSIFSNSLSLFIIFSFNLDNIHFASVWFLSYKFEPTVRNFS